MIIRKLTFIQGPSKMSLVAAKQKAKGKKCTKRIVLKDISLHNCGQLPLVFAFYIFAVLLSHEQQAFTLAAPSEPLLDNSCQDLSNLIVKIDCHPDNGPSEAECLRRGCCWQPVSFSNEPSCFFSGSRSCYSIELNEKQTLERESTPSASSKQYEHKQKDFTADREASTNAQGNTDYELLAHAKPNTHEQNIVVGADDHDDNDDDEKRPNDSVVDEDDDAQFGEASQIEFLLSRKPNCQPSGFPNDASRLRVKVKVYGESLVRIKISEPDKQRFEPKLPEITLPISKKYIKKRNNNINSTLSSGHNHSNFPKNQFTDDGDGDDSAAFKWLKVGKHILVGFTEPYNNNNNNNNNNKLDKSPADTTTTNHGSSKTAASDVKASTDGVRLVSTSGRLVLKVVHSLSGAVLFETDLGKLIYSEQFIQQTIHLPSSYIYGLGQHLGKGLLKRQLNSSPSKTYTMFNYAHPPIDDGRTSYSSYPFLINLVKLHNTKEINNIINHDDDDGGLNKGNDAESINNNNNSNNNNNMCDEERKNSSSYRCRLQNEFELRRKVMATGVLMLNSNAMDVVLQSPTGSAAEEHKERGAVTWRLTGGIVDLYLFLGPKPHDVIEQYQALVGKPAMPPSWALGYHQSRMNYRDVMPIKMSWARTRSAAIPMESFWTDIEFMQGTTSYTVKTPELNEFVETLQEMYDMHYVTVVDPAIDVKEDENKYKALKLAKQMNLFASAAATTTTFNHNNTSNEQTSPSDNKHNNMNLRVEPALVTTWTDSGSSALIDFTNPHAVDYLKQVLSDYKDKLNFNGLWLDMNEPEIFANHNNNNNNNQQDGGEANCPFDEVLKYEPGKRRLSDRTLCMSASFHEGLHRDVHNLYAFYQAKAHFEALKSLDTTHRPLIISRAQFVGQGKYSGTWLGDMASTFDHLRWSLIGTIESNWFGQPLVGSDICGFFGNTNDELCSRWFSFGAFYPFARNHNDGSARDQDPGSLGQIVQDSARVALMRRYSLLPYIYSLFYENHLKGQPVVRSVLFEFFDQYHTITDNLDRLPQINDQMMLGPALMLAPVLEEDTDSRFVHLAPGLWYDISIGLPGTVTEEGHYEAAHSNWPIKNDQTNDSSQTIEYDDYSRKRVKNLLRPIECNDEYGCWLPHQYTPLGSINMYLRGGRIVPTFYKFSHTASITKLWQQSIFFLEIGLDASESAYGSMYWDDGESDPNLQKYNQVDFWVSNNRLVMSIVEERNKELAVEIAGFVVYGQKSITSPEILETLQIDHGVGLRFSYDEDKQILSCLFTTPMGDEPKPLKLTSPESIKIKW